MIPTHNSFFGSQIFPAWYLAKNPDKRVMLVGHEADFAATHGRKARDILTQHGHLFGVGVHEGSRAVNRWDIDGHLGGMLTLGVKGSPIGRGGNVVIVDDPYPSFEEALKPEVRKRVIEFCAGTLFTRVQAGGTIIVIMARWHPEDLVGHLKAAQPGVWTEICMPALCTDPEVDPLGRSLGEPLWPEEWPTRALEQAHRDVSISKGEAVWEAQYQQNPQASEGGMFDENTWSDIDVVPIDRIKRWVRAWDLAATDGAGDWTVGVLLGELPDKAGWVIADVTRGQWPSHRVRAKMLDCAKKDPKGTTVRFPQDPGQAGKDQKHQLATMLRGFKIHSKVVTGSKEVRAVGLSSQQMLGNLHIPKGPRSAAWRGALVSETNSFPYGTHDDIVDALADAFNVLAGNRARVIA